MQIEITGRTEERIQRLIQDGCYRSAEEAIAALVDERTQSDAHEHRNGGTVNDRAELIRNLQKEFREFRGMLGDLSREQMLADRHQGLAR